VKVNPLAPCFRGAFYRVFYLPETDSTNTRMKAWLQGECPFAGATAPRAFDLLAAGRQTAGRGRLGRHFLSPESGLYFSVLIPQADAEKASKCTPLCAAAMAKALEETGVQGINVKWVNDLYKNGRKVAGILCEYTQGHVVCGIGLNVSAPPDGFPPEAGMAGALGGKPICPEKLLSGFMNALNAYLRRPHEALAFYRERDLLKGRQVTVQRGEETFLGTALGVNDDFALLVSHGGRVEALSSGEVIHVTMEDKHARGTL